MILLYIECGWEKDHLIKYVLQDVRFTNYFVIAREHLIHKYHLGRILGEYRGVGQVEDCVHGESHQRVRQPFRFVLRAQRATNPEQDAEQRDVRSDRVFGTKGEWCLLNRFECGFVNQRRHIMDPQQVEQQVHE